MNSILYIIILSIFLLSCENNEKEKELLEREKELLEKENKMLRNENSEKNNNQDNTSRRIKEHPQPSFPYTQRYVSYNHNGSGINEYLFINSFYNVYYYSSRNKVYMEMDPHMNAIMSESIVRAYPNEKQATTYRFRGNDDDINNIYGIIVLKNGNIVCMDMAGDKQIYVPF
jgi:hypothetical protein